MLGLKTRLTNGKGFSLQSTGQNSSRYGFTSFVDIRTCVYKSREIGEEGEKEASATGAGKLETGGRLSVNQ